MEMSGNKKTPPDPAGGVAEADGVAVAVGLAGEPPCGVIGKAALLAQGP